MAKNAEKSKRRRTKCCGDFHTPDSLKKARENLPQYDTSSDTEQHPNR